MKKFYFVLIQLAFLTTVSFSQITWMGNESTTLAATNYLGDRIQFEIQSYPIASDQGTQVYIDWGNDGYGGTQNTDWFSLGWDKNESNNSFWKLYVTMRTVGTHNRKYLGYQSGCADYITISLGTFTVTALNNPTPATPTANSSSVELSWAKDAQSHNVMIVRISDGQTFTEPSQGTAYVAGNSIGSGVVIYNGSELSFSDNNVTTSATYTYKFYSENNSYYSPGIATASVTALPVELTLFTAAAVEKGVDLKWSTATEQNNLGFDVERKFAEKGQWGKIGFVAGNGTCNSTREYSYTDNSTLNGKYFYRLKQIDNDGQFKYSQIAEVNVNTTPEGFIIGQNYPNPFNPSTTIKFGLDKSTEVSLVVFDQLGRQVATLFNGQVEASKMYSVEFNASKLSSGVYFYKL